MNTEKEAPQLSTVQFRVPLALQREIDARTQDSDLRTFITTATEQFLLELDETPAKDLLLPKGFSISTASKVITVPIPNGLVQQGVYEIAPKMYHSIRGFCLLAAAWKALTK